jgi:hypothetical protein
VKLGRDVPDHYGYALKGARIARGWTLRVVADATGFSSYRIDRWERELDRPTPEQFAIVWRHLVSDEVKVRA